MLIVGMTGGIGSGKSTVSRLFEALGVPLIDTDVVAREVVRPGSEGIEAIRRAFGDKYIQADGRMDRQAMRRLVFGDDAARERLEAILHPLIRQAVWQWVEQLQAPYCLVVVPLLLEKGWNSYFDRILVIDIDEALQIERTMQRDGLSREEVEAIIQSQAGREQRLAIANDIIENHLDEASLQRQVEGLHRKYLKLAKGNNP